MDGCDVFPGGVIGRARRWKNDQSVSSLYLGDLSNITPEQSTEVTELEKTPGPATYDVDRHNRSLTPRSARIGSARRHTSWYLDDEPEDGRVSPPPGPLTYEAEAVKDRLSPRSRCARMTSPRSPVVISRKGYMACDLMHENSPGPGDYGSRHEGKTLPRNNSAIFGSESRNTCEWFNSNGRVHEWQPNMLRSRSALAITDGSKKGSQDEASCRSAWDSSPGPGAYDLERHKRAFSSQSARVSTIPRKLCQVPDSSRRVLVSPGECAKDQPTPGPASYDTSEAWKHTAHPAGAKSPSARVLTPPRRQMVPFKNSLAAQGDPCEVPGPGAYNTSQRQGTLVGRSVTACALSPRLSESLASKEGTPRTSRATSPRRTPTPRATPRSTPRTTPRRQHSPARSSFEAATPRKPWEFHGDSNIASMQGDSEASGSSSRKPSYLKPTFSSKRKAGPTTPSRGAPQGSLEKMSSRPKQWISRSGRGLRVDQRAHGLNVWDVRQKKPGMIFEHKNGQELGIAWLNQIQGVHDRPSAGFRAEHFDIIYPCTEWDNVILSDSRLVLKNLLGYIVSFFPGRHIELHGPGARNKLEGVLADGIAAGLITSIPGPTGGTVQAYKFKKAGFDEYMQALVALSQSEQDLVIGYDHYGKPSLDKAQERSLIDLVLFLTSELVLWSLKLRKEALWIYVENKPSLELSQGVSWLTQKLHDPPHDDNGGFFEWLADCDGTDVYKLEPVTASDRTLAVLQDEAVLGQKLEIDFGAKATVEAVQRGRMAFQIIADAGERVWIGFTGPPADRANRAKRHMQVIGKWFNNADWISTWKFVALDQQEEGRLESDASAAFMDFWPDCQDFAVVSCGTSSFQIVAPPGNLHIPAGLVHIREPEGFLIVLKSLIKVLWQPKDDSSMRSVQLPWLKSSSEKWMQMLRLELKTILQRHSKAMPHAAGLMSKYEWTEGFAYSPLVQGLQEMLASLP